MWFHAAWPKSCQTGQMWCLFMSKSCKNMHDFVNLRKKCQVDKGTKVESVEAAPSQPEVAEGPPVKNRVLKRRIKETFPTSDRQPSSEYYYSDGDDDNQEVGEEETDQDDEPSDPLALHEEMHEELYDLPTPTKYEVHGSSSSIVPTELEKTPEPSMVDVSDDESPSGDRDGKHVGGATGTHKDWSWHINACSMHQGSECFAVSLLSYILNISLCYLLLLHAFVLE